MDDPPNQSAAKSSPSDLEGRINPFVAQLAENRDREDGGEDFDAARCKLWGEALASNTTITEMDGIRSELVDALCGALHGNRTIQELRLNDNDIGEREAAALADALEVNSTITSIDLSDNAIGDQGAVALAVALKVNRTITTINLSDNAIGERGAMALAAALEVNSTITTIALPDNAIGERGAMAVADALEVNRTITTIELRGNAIGDQGGVALAEALKVNYTITMISLSDNGFGAEWAMALAEALKVNSTITDIDLHGNAIGDQGAVALAAALEVNTTISIIDLSFCRFGDVGTLCLCEAMKSNSSVTYLRVDRYDFALNATAWALQSASHRLIFTGSVYPLQDSFHPVFEKWKSSDRQEMEWFANVFWPQCTVAELHKFGAIAAVLLNNVPLALERMRLYPDNLAQVVLELQEPSVIPWRSSGKHLLQDSFDSALKKWKSNDRLEMHWFANVFWPQCVVAELHKYGAVAAVLANNVPLALERMRLYPDNLAQVVQELKVFTVIPWRSSGIIAELLDFFNGKDAAWAVSAVVEAVQGSGRKLSVVNVHICGEGCAGKTTTREAIVQSMTSSVPMFLQPLIHEIPLVEGRTLGMVSTVMDYRGQSGRPIRALLHDYGGQEEFRANHAAHLSAANSVYLLVLPLWDMRPRPAPDQKKPVDEPMDLEELVAKYTNWLKFINTIVEEKGARCVTALNFVKQFKAKPRWYTVQEAIAALAAVQARFSENALCKLIFVGEAILVNSNIPSSVHKYLLPVLKPVLAALEADPVPVAPTIQTVLADMAVPGKWPLFTYESRLQAMIHEAIAAKHTPSVSNFPEQSVRNDIVRTIAHITQGMLESRRDIVVFKVHSGERVAINFPNWLTEKLLGSLFDPRRRVRVNEAAAVSASTGAADPTHLLSATDIDKAVKANLDATTRAMLDAKFIPKLLQHVGVCIPVVLGTNGLARGVADGVDLSRVTHWFPAFSTTLMKDSDGILLKDYDHIVARQFMLANPEFCIFPPGYFSSLFVSIVGLHDQAHLVQLYQDGMELCSGSENFQIVVRRCADSVSFVVTVATRGTPPGSSLAFDTMQSITQLIFGPGSWRRNVQVQECGLHPTKLLKSAAIPVEYLLPRLKDPALREVSLPFYFGMERRGPDRMVALQLEAVLAKLDAADKRAEERHAEVVSGLDSLSAQVIAQHNVVARVEDALDKASAAAADTGEQVQAMCHYLLEALPAPGRGDPEAAKEFAQMTATARAFLEERRAILDRATILGVTQLQQMKSEIVDELGKTMEGMQRSILTKLHEREEAQSAAAEERLRNLLAGHYQATGDALREVQRQLTDQILELKTQQQATLGTGSVQAVQESIMRLQESIAAVQTAQRNDLYGVYELPLLAEIKAPEPTGTAKDAALRCLYEVYRLHFLCPVCGDPAASDPKKHGYKLLVTKGWVAKVSKVLKVSLLALQVVSLVTPLPLPRLAELTRYLPTEELKSVAKALNFGVKKIKNEVNATAGGVKKVQDATPQPPEITLEHVVSIRELLLLAGESAPPKHTGLSPAICAATQQCAWVCAGKCRDEYMARGDACLAIKMKFG